VSFLLVISSGLLVISSGFLIKYVSQINSLCEMNDVCINVGLQVIFLENGLRREVNSGTRSMLIFE
jgi:hypothetical protein